MTLCNIVEFKIRKLPRQDWPNHVSPLKADSIFFNWSQKRKLKIRSTGRIWQAIAELKLQESPCQGIKEGGPWLADSRKHGPHSHSCKELNSANKKNDLGNRFFPRVFWWELNSFDTWISASWYWAENQGILCRTSDLYSCKIINECCEVI